MEMSTNILSGNLCVGWEWHLLFCKQAPDKTVDNDNSLHH